MDVATATILNLLDLHHKVLAPGVPFHQYSGSCVVLSVGEHSAHLWVLGFLESSAADALTTAQTATAGFWGPEVHRLATVLTALSHFYPGAREAFVDANVPVVTEDAHELLTDADWSLELSLDPRNVSLHITQAPYTGTFSEGGLLMAHWVAQKLRVVPLFEPVCNEFIQHEAEVAAEYLKYGRFLLAHRSSALGQQLHRQAAERCRNLPAAWRQGRPNEEQLVTLFHYLFSDVDLLDQAARVTSNVYAL